MQAFKNKTTSMKKNLEWLLLGMLIFLIFTLDSSLILLKPWEKKALFLLPLVHAQSQDDLIFDVENSPQDLRYRIELALEVIGHPPGRVDGIFDQNTVKAIKSWQEEKQESPTGLLILSQVITLFRSLRMEIEYALEALGYSPGSIDGNFDQNTKAAIEAWQQENGEEVGQLTFDQISKLFESLRVKIRTDEDKLNLNHTEKISIALKLLKDGHLPENKAFPWAKPFDEDMRAAIKNWQQANGKRVTGYLNSGQSKDLISAGKSIAKPFQFQRITKGFFMMGSPESERRRKDDEQQHTVTFTKDFEIQTTETTQWHWFLVMRNNPSYFKNFYHCPQEHLVIDDIHLCPNHPVESVSWNSVQRFILKLNQMASNGQSYNLPTEAQWECAARGGTSTAYFFGNNRSDLHDYAWLAENSNQTQSVGRLEKNPFYLYDVYGNAQEMVQDFYTPDYLSFFLGFIWSSTREDPLVNEAYYSSYSLCNDCRVMRGGNWKLYDKSLFRSASRSAIKPSLAKNFVGFRLRRE